MNAVYDLLLHGGELVDPGQGIRGRRDVAIQAGQVAAVAEHIPLTQARKAVDVGGKVVTPGLVDIHTHFYWGVFSHSVRGDETFLPQGVTTAVDGGSSGHINFPGLREYIIARSTTRMYAFIHVAAIGLTPQAAFGELYDLRFAQVEQAIQCVRENPDVVLGIKVRITHNGTGVENALPALRFAREAADGAKTRLMVHVSDSPVPLSAILEHMHPGDIATHIFGGRPYTLLDRWGKVLPEVRAAQERGVVLDIARGPANLDYQVTQAALDQGLPPDTISTDAARPPTPGYILRTLPYTMSEFMAMGMSLEEVVQCTTSRAAQVIGKEDLVGTLKVGYPADIAVFELQEGDVTFTDWIGNTLKGKQLLIPVMTVRQGKVVAAPGLQDSSGS